MRTIQFLDFEYFIKTSFSFDKKRYIKNYSLLSKMQILVSQMYCFSYFFSIKGLFYARVGQFWDWNSVPVAETSSKNVPSFQTQFNQQNLVDKSKNDLLWFTSPKTKYLFVLNKRIRYNQYLFWNSTKMVYLDISNWIYSKSWTDKKSSLMVPKVILNYKQNEFNAKKNLKRSKSCKLYIASRDHQWSQ